jgi:hypothetical protein
MGTKNSKPESQTVIQSPPRLTATTVDFDTDDLDLDSGSNTHTSFGLKSLTELKSNTSYKSNVSNKSQKKRKSRKPEELRKIRDKPNRTCRKASTAPDQAFIVEEALLEDLCAIAGEEAHEGGNIILTREKEELIRRLSTNHATADIFKNTTNMRKFSTQSIRGDPTLSMTMDSQGRNTLSNTPSSHSNKERSRKSSVLTLINTDGVQDPVRLRRQSIKQVQTTSPKGAHELMTQANYRTEIQALKMAQKRESCTCARNCFALCNIYI